MSLEVILERGGVVESRHGVHAAVVGPGGALEARSGDPERVTHMRSAAKPVQALPLVTSGAAAAREVTLDEVAVACGSHGGEDAHLARVRSLLARAGCTEDDLECGPHEPLFRDAAAALRARNEAPGRIHNNCSGKHAAMLVVARHAGWEIRDYRLAGHPLQRRILAEVARWSGVPADRIPLGVDGCGVVSFALPLRAMAAAFARLAEAARAGDEGPRTILEAMARHPVQVAGTGRLCTAAARATGGRVVAKVGAEGVYCAVDRDSGLALALKVEDGARRAVEPALVAALAQLGLADEGELARLDTWRAPVVPNTRDEPAAHLLCRGALDGGAA